jgi:hypothetical protein
MAADPHIIGKPPARAAGPPPQPPGPFKSAEEAAASIPPVMGAAFAKAMIAYNLKRADDGTWVWTHDQRVMVRGTLGDRPAQVAAVECS